MQEAKLAMVGIRDNRIPSTLGHRSSGFWHWRIKHEQRRGRRYRNTPERLVRSFAGVDCGFGVLATNFVLNKERTFCNVF